MRANAYVNKPYDGKDASELRARFNQCFLKFEDDTTEPVYFLNPLDISQYLANANVTTQNAFGMNYIKDFLGLGTVIVSSRVTQGTFVATAKENFVMYYLTMNGDVASAFGLTADETGLIGINSGYRNEERAQIESLVMSGIQLLVEYAEGVVKGTISGAAGASAEPSAQSEAASEAASAAARAASKTAASK